MEQRVKNLIEKVKNFTSRYEPKNVYKEKHIDNDSVLYYFVVLFAEDDTRDLSFLIEFHKCTKTLSPIICNTRKYNLYETINIDSVEQAINEFQPLQ